MKKFFLAFCLLFTSVGFAQTLQPPLPQGSFYQKGKIVSQSGVGIIGCGHTDFILADGSGCASGGGSGTVGAGLAGQFAYYPSDGTTVAGSGYLTFDGATLILGDANSPDGTGVALGSVSIANVDTTSVSLTPTTLSIQAASTRHADDVGDILIATDYNGVAAKDSGNITISALNEVDATAGGDIVMTATGDIAAEPSRAFTAIAKSDVNLVSNDNVTPSSSTIDAGNITTTIDVEGTVDADGAESIALTAVGDSATHDVGDVVLSSTNTNSAHGGNIRMIASGGISATSTRGTTTNLTDTGPSANLINLDVETTWIPTSTIGGTDSIEGLFSALNVNFDAQSTATGGFTSADIEAINNSTTRASNGFTAAYVYAGNDGGAATTTVRGVNAQINNEGSVTADETGFNTRLTSNGTTVSEIQAYATEAVTLTSGSAGVVYGYNMPAAQLSGGATVTNYEGFHSAVNLNAGITNAYAIYAVGTAPSKFSAPLIAGGTSSVSGCSLDTVVGGKWAGSFKSGTTGTCTVTITPGITATNGFSCWSNDLTTPADIVHQTAYNTTTATIAGTTVSGDLITWGCIAF
jgi:hypothetical protein